MPVFAICNNNRTLKKTVVAGGLQELLEKGNVKLLVDATIVVLAKNGAEIDEDDVLLSLKDQELLMFLEPLDVWFPILQENSPVPVVTNHGDGSNCPEDPVPNQSASTSCYDDPQPSTSYETAASVTVGNFPTPSLGHFLQPPQENPPSMTVAMISKTTALPRFSDYIHTHLIQAKSSLVWHAMIREAAQYYITYFPDIGKSNNLDYQTVGQKMFVEWPDIARMGVKPWSVFASDLSSRIRYLRWANKRKSMGVPGLSPPPTTKAARLNTEGTCNLPTRQRIATSEYTGHCKELTRQYSKFQNATNKETEMKIAKEIIIILKETFVNRRDWILGLEQGAVKPILDGFPCFSHPIFVYAELKLMKGNEEVGLIKKRLEKVFDMALSMIPEKQRKVGILGDIQAFHMLEKETAFDRGKGMKTKSILVHKEVESPAEADKLRSEIGSAKAPYMVIITSSDHTCAEIIDVIIPADNCILDGFSSEGVRTAVLSLLGVYYFAWISYPRIHSQVLGFFQQYTFKETFRESKSRKFVQFINKFERLF